MMKVAIEALGIHTFGGGRTATLSLLEALFALDPQNEYLVFLTQPEPSLETAAGNVRQSIVPIQNRFLARVWAQFRLPGAVRGFDLVHFAKNLGVFGLKIPTIVTIYDLTTLIRPEIFPRSDVWYWRTIQRRTLREADRVIAISQTTAGDLLRYYKLRSDRVQVIYPAISAQFKQASAEEIARVRQRYGLPTEYFLHVGRIDRKKNLTALVRAFARFRERQPFEGKLVLAGEEYPKARDLDLHPIIQELGLLEEVIFTGAVPDSDLPPLYSAALASVFPTLHEGFGLAPVEAMACGSPLIAHRAGALQEAAGEAALLLDDPGVESIAQALCILASEPALREELRERGLARAAHFSREESARQTLALYKEVIGA
jgi:glycosyltransferase involved in cell wall biosynthesis